MLITKTDTPELAPIGKGNLFFTADGHLAYVKDDGQKETIYNKTEVDAALADKQSDIDARLPVEDPAIAADDAFYFGDKETVGSWRITRDGDNLVMQRLETVAEVDTWVTKSTILATE